MKVTVKLENDDGGPISSHQFDLAGPLGTVEYTIPMYPPTLFEPYPGRRAYVEHVIVKAIIRDV